MDWLKKIATLPVEDLCQLSIPHSLQSQALSDLSERYWPFHQKQSAKHILTPQHFQGGRELVVFGGSFSPWHEGHTQALRSLKALRPHSILIVCPDWNPQKSQRSDLAHGWERWVNINKTIHPEFPDIPVYPGLLTWRRPTPTSQWLPELNYETKSILIGADSFHGMLNWIMPEKLLLTLSSIYVLPRSDKEDDFDTMKTKILSTLLKAKETEKLQKEVGINIIRLPHHPYEDVSSSQRREQNKKV